MLQKNGVAEVEFLQGSGRGVNLIYKAVAGCRGFGDWSLPREERRDRRPAY